MFCTDRHFETSANIFNTSLVHPILQFPTLNYTVVLNKNTSSILFINVTYVLRNALLHQLRWKQNGHAIDLTVSPRISIQAERGLTINAVEPSDAGCYEVIISSSRGCDSAQFEVSIECETELAIHIIE